MAKRRATPGTGQLNLEIELALLERLRAFGRGRGEKLRWVVEMALRRHMDNPPPPPELVPLPPLPPPSPAVPVDPPKATKPGRRPK